MSDPIPDPNPQPSVPPTPQPLPPPPGPSVPGPQASATPPIRPGGPERSWEVGCHLAAFSGYLTGFGWILGPLFVWLLKRAEFPSIDAHAKEEMNFQISVFIYQIALVVVGFLTCGVTWFLCGALAVAQLVLMIIASIKASEGTLYRYPWTIRLIS